MDVVFLITTNPQGDKLGHYKECSLYFGHVIIMGLPFTNPESGQQKTFSSLYFTCIVQSSQQLQLQLLQTYILTITNDNMHWVNSKIKDEQFSDLPWTSVTELGCHTDLLLLFKLTLNIILHSHTIMALHNNHMLIPRLIKSKETSKKNTPKDKYVYVCQCEWRNWT